MNQKLIFEQITEFINELNTNFGEKLPSLKRYHSLFNLNKDNESFKTKNIKIFKRFINKKIKFLDNRNELFKNAIIKYNKDAQINLSIIWSKLEDNILIKDNIYKYIQILSKLYNPDIEISQQNKLNDIDMNTNTTNVINDVMDIAKDINMEDMDMSNPMAAITGLMKSDIFSKLTQSSSIQSLSNDINNGDLSMEKLFSQIGKTMDAQIK